MANLANSRTRGLPALWNDLFNPRGELDRFFDGRSSTLGAALYPSVDVQETEDGIRVTAELPGLKSEDVYVTVENGILSITGEKSREREEKDEKSTYHLVERQFGRFERSFSLPKSIDPDKIIATFDDGVLTVELAKAAAAKPKRIKIG